MSGTNAQSPTAHTLGQPGTRKNSFTSNRPRSFAHGSEAMMGLGTVPAVHTSVRDGIATPSAKKTLLSVRLLTPGIKADFHTAFLEHFLAVSSQTFTQFR